MIKNCGLEESTFFESFSLLIRIKTRRNTSRNNDQKFTEIKKKDLVFNVIYLELKRKVKKHMHAMYIKVKLNYIKIKLLKLYQKNHL